MSALGAGMEPDERRPRPGGADADAEARAVIDACLRNRPLAWERFLDRYGRLVTHLARENLRSYGIPFHDEDADDIAEEVLANLLERRCRVLRSFRAPFRFIPWLAVVVRRRCNRHARRKHIPMASLSEGDPDEDAPRLPAGPSPDPAPEMEKKEVRRVLRDEIARLLEPGRTIIRQFYFEGRKYREIARQTGISIKTVSSSLWRAKARLEERLRARGIVDEEEEEGTE